MFDLVNTILKHMPLEDVLTMYLAIGMEPGRTFAYLCEKEIWVGRVLKQFTHETTGLPRNLYSVMDECYVTNNRVVLEWIVDNLVIGPSPRKLGVVAGTVTDRQLMGTMTKYPNTIMGNSDRSKWFRTTFVDAMMRGDKVIVAKYLALFDRQPVSCV